MKSFKLMVIIFVVLFGLNQLVQAQAIPTTITTPATKIKYPYWGITPLGGAIFPIGIFGDNFKAGGTVGLDIGYRLNKEVGFYVKGGYYFLNSKITTAPIGHYIEYIVGPRYYFTKASIKSSLFAEVGVGGYTFTQNSYVNPLDTTQFAQISDTRPGVNAGLGASVALGKNVNLMFKTKYHVLFTPNGSTSFVTALGGIEFLLR